MTVQVNEYSTDSGSADLELHVTMYYEDADAANDASLGFWRNNAVTIETWEDIFDESERKEFNGWIWEEL